jgi:hypothetical protein
MSEQALGAPVRFADRVLRALERVEHRRIVTKADMEAIYRLRYDAYTRGGALPPSSVGHSEKEDHTPNCAVIATFLDGELASTSRYHVASNEDDLLPSSKAFPEAILPVLQNGRVIIDPTRRATRLDLSRQFSEMAYIALTPVCMAAEYFGADFVLAIVPTRHQPFYRRVFGCEPWSPPRLYPGSNVEVVCMAFNYPAEKERIETHYPFFKSTPAEREKLFGGVTYATTKHPTGQAKAGLDATARM